MSQRLPAPTECFGFGCSFIACLTAYLWAWASYCRGPRLGDVSNCGLVISFKEDFPSITHRPSLNHDLQVIDARWHSSPLQTWFHYSIIVARFYHDFRIALNVCHQDPKWLMGIYLGFRGMIFSTAKKLQSWKAQQFSSSAMKHHSPKTKVSSSGSSMQFSECLVPRRASAFSSFVRMVPRSWTCLSSLNQSLFYFGYHAWVSSQQACNFHRQDSHFQSFV